MPQSDTNTSLWRNSGEEPADFLAGGRRVRAIACRFLQLFGPEILWRLTIVRNARDIAVPIPSFP
jgi:hypothetical protein